ncbi:hypothetical protein PR048_025105 [Dryococelus australis]|uniref:Uncharacterized protein n=1 Tax=Dryococelus australis TaxID=614101 RepID=A0ABQ9GQB9_9NEOP|nr:hypothetical protein PR048_025105 [Dryococelus australis]
MSSERNTVYCVPPPPAPPLLPLLINEVPATLATQLGGSCTVVTICTCNSPEQELLDLRDRLWLHEGTPQPPHISFYRYIEPVLQDGPK